MTDILYKLSRGRFGAISLDDHEAIREALRDILPSSQPEGAERVVIWALTGKSTKINAVMGSIGKALEIRGLAVEIVLCDEVLDACDKLRHAHVRGLEKAQWKTTCAECYLPGLSYYNAWGLTSLTLSHLVSSERIEEIKALVESLSDSETSKYTYRGIDLGRHVQMSWKKYFASSRPSKSPEFRRVQRSYLFSAVLNLEAFHNYLESRSPDHVFMPEGEMISWGPVFDYALANNIHIVRMNSSYNDTTVYLEHGRSGSDRYEWKISDEFWQLRKRKSLSSQEEGSLDSYLDKAMKGRFQLRKEQLEGEMAEAQKFRTRVLRQLSSESADISGMRGVGSVPGNSWAEDIISQKLVVGFFSHVDWDPAFLDFEALGYTDPVDWVLDSIGVMQEVPEVLWIVKVHPHELAKGHSTTLREIQQHFPALPEHIQVLGLEADVNSYDLMLAVDAGVTYTGTVGLEFPLLQKPVLVAGPSTCSDNEFTVSPQTREQYHDCLRNIDQLCAVGETELELTRRYAYAYFIQRQIPLETLHRGSSAASSVGVKPDFAKCLVPGSNKYVDLVCDRFLNGEEFWIDPHGTM